MTPAPGVTVRGLLDSRPDALGLSLELLAGAAGLDRRITSPHVQKTGLALAGFQEYLQAGPRADLRRERDPVSREPRRGRAGSRALGSRSRSTFPACSITGGFTPPPELVGRGRARRPAGAADAGRDADRDRQADVHPRRLARRAHGHARRAHGHPRPRRAHRRGERHRQERVRARPDRSRAPAGGRRHRGDPAARRNHPHRHVPRADAPSHGAARRSASSTSRTCSASPRRGRRSASNWSCSSSAGIRLASTSGSASTTSSSRCSGFAVPLIRMPVAPGRNIAILVEVAARNQLLRSRGHHAARALAERLEEALRAGAPFGRTGDRRRRRGRGERGVTRQAGGRSEQAAGEAGRKAGRTGKVAGRQRAAVHHPDRAVGIRQVAGDSRARGPRLLLRRQPADDADSDDGEAVAAGRRRHRKGRDRRRRARRQPAVVVSEDASRACAGCRGSTRC